MYAMKASAATQIGMGFIWFDADFLCMHHSAAHSHLHRARSAFAASMVDFQGLRALLQVHAQHSCSFPMASACMT